MMADHGTIILKDAPTPSVITGYTIVGAASTGPAVPTTGQIWPRGNP